MTKRQNTRHNVLVADMVKHFLVEVLSLAEKPDSIICKEWGTECDVEDGYGWVSPEDHHQLYGAYS